VDAAAILDALGAVSAGAVRPGTADDAVGGVVPAAVVAPISTEDVRAVVGFASTAGLTLCPAGTRTAIAVGGRPRSLDVIVSTSELDDVLEYNPGDLVVRAQAGVPLARLQQTLGDKGQMLAVDPPGMRGTLGGVVAGNASGPCRHRYGSVRDLLIGVTVVRADGTMARAGGKVVKNVAGYDLCKLMTGSRGTLAVLVDVTFRLHPLPEARAWIRHDLDGTSALESVLASYRRTRLEPAAMELGFDLSTGGGRLDVAFDGRPKAVAAHLARAIGSIGGYEAPGPSDPVDDDGGMVLRLVVEPAAVAAVTDKVIRLQSVSLPGSFLSGRAGLGVLALRLPLTALPDPVELVRRVRDVAGQYDGTAVVERAPEDVKERLDVWGPVRGLELMRRVKHEFDPAGVLSPGRFVGGI
jgi:glycolate oxidase FAD binding subunit